MGGGEGGSHAPLRWGGRPGEVQSPQQVQWTRVPHTGYLKTVDAHWEEGLPCGRMVG